MKRILKPHKIAAICLAVLLLAALLPVASVRASPGWEHYRVITISNGGSAQTNYQVRVNITDTSNMAVSGADLRFTDDGNTEVYPYYVESWATNDAYVWVRVSSIASGSSYMWMWYGNSGASSESSGANTFIAFDWKLDGPIGGRTSFGGYHTCALVSDGTMKSWGYNSYGQLGDGSTTQRNTPVSVSGISTAVAITAGVFHTLALLSDGTVKAWGRNNYGQLGDGTTTSNGTPVSVSEISDAVAIAAGFEHTCALLSDGTVKAWGLNNYGQLGDGTTTDSSTPVSVSDYDLGGRYDKSGGIYAIPDPNSDTYFVCKYASTEPTTSTGSPQDSGGVAPVPELPTIILVGGGLAALATYLILQRRKKSYARA